MKKCVIILCMLIISGAFFLPCAFAGEKADCIYKSKIDQTIAVYQGRLYLIDSEYTILSDIGKEAKDKINYLTRNKQQIIQEMKNTNVGFTSEKINGFICQKLRNSRIIGLGYTSAGE